MTEAFNPQKSSDCRRGPEARDSPSDSGLGVFVIREGIYHETWWEIALVPHQGLS